MRSVSVLPRRKFGKQQAAIDSNAVVTVVRDGWVRGALLKTEERPIEGRRERAAAC